MPRESSHGNAATAAAAPGLSAALTALLALGTGASVAALYYAQPLLGILMADLGVGPRVIGWVPTLTQLGYAGGLFFLAPLGDRYDRRQLILVKAVVLTVALLLAGAAHSAPVLLAASFVIGWSATLAQDLLPAAATLAPLEQRGKAVGTVMTGLLTGILLSRVVSGIVAETLGWNAIFLIAAASIAVLGALLWRGLPAFAPTTQEPYSRLLASLGTLWTSHPALRYAAIAQGLLALGFSAFWSTLAVMLRGEPFHLGAAAAGSFGIAGAAGALMAPVAGRLADRIGAPKVALAMAAITMLSFLAMFGAPLFGTHGQLVLLVLCTVGFDLGVQSALISHQTIIYGIAPEARSRLNAILMVSVFIGMALGGALGSQALGLYGWNGVVSLAALAAAGAVVVRLLSRRVG